MLFSFTASSESSVAFVVISELIFFRSEAELFASDMSLAISAVTDELSTFSFFYIF